MESFWARPIQCFFTEPCRPLIQTEISDRISFWIHGSLIQSCVEWRALHVTVEGLSDLFKWVLLQPFIVRLFIHHILDDMLFCTSSQNNPPIMFYSKPVCLLCKLPLECSPINLGPVLKALYTLRTSSLHLIFHLTVNLSKTLNPVLRTYPMP